MNTKILIILLVLNHTTFASQEGKEIAWGMISRANGTVKRDENAQLKMYLEDTFRYAQTSKGNVFVIADGRNNPHGKNRTCDKIQNMLPDFFKQSDGDVKEALKTAFSQVEDLANEYDQKRNLADESSALAICIDHTGHTHCANVGNSSLIAFSGQHCNFATKNHDIDNNDEIRRIRTHIGEIKFRNFIRIIDKSQGTEARANNRIIRSTNSKLTRFIGNPEAKELSKKNRINNGPLIAEPELYEIVGNRYLVMATAGFRDRFDANYVASKIIKLMQYSNEQLNHLCSKKSKMTLDRCAIFTLANMVAKPLGHGGAETLAYDLEEKTMNDILQKHNIANDKRLCDAIVETFKNNGLNYFEEKNTRLAQIPQCPDIIVEEEGCGVQSEKCRYIASILAKKAIERGSKDNITICVIDLHASHSSIDNLKYYIRLNKQILKFISLPLLIIFAIILKNNF